MFSRNQLNQNKGIIISTYLHVFFKASFNCISINSTILDYRDIEYKSWLLTIKIKLIFCHWDYDQNHTINIYRLFLIQGILAFIISFSLYGNFPRHIYSDNNLLIKNQNYSWVPNILRMHEKYIKLWIKDEWGSILNVMNHAVTTSCIPWKP